MGRREMVSLVGAGGKTSVLSILAGGLAAAGRSVVATTTTAMLRDELAAVGPLVMDESDAVLAAGLAEALANGRAVAAARGPGAEGKVTGIPPSTADRLWAEGVADCIIVEADGSRGLPLKAFGPDEPQVPDASTTIIAVAGLDAVGRSLTSGQVHRAEVLAARLGVPVRSEVTPALLVRALREQLVELRRRWPAARIVCLLNKADGAGDEALGSRIARDLLAGSGREPGRRNADRPRDRLAAERRGDPCPDLAVVASLRRGFASRIPAAER